MTGHGALSLFMDNKISDDRLIKNKLYFLTLILC